MASVELASANPSEHLLNAEHRVGEGEGHWDDSKRALVSGARLVIGDLVRCIPEITDARQKVMDGGLRKDV